MNLPEPKTATEALRQARTWEKAQLIANSLAIGGEYFAYETATPGLWNMTKRSYSNAPDTVYVIDLRPTKPTCTCPNFIEYNDFCKHTLALQTALEKDAEQAQIDAYEAEERERANAEHPVYGCDPYARY